MQRILVILLSCVLTTAIRGAEIEIVTGQIPPYSYEDDGVAKGVAVELVQAMAKIVGHSGKVTFLPWKRAVSMAEKGSPPRLVIPLNRSPERESRFTWVTPLLQDSTMLITKKGGKRQKIVKVETALTLATGVLMGSPLETELKDKGFKNVDPGVDEETNARKLHLGRLDVWFVAGMVAPFVYRRLKLPEDELEFGASLQVNDLHLGATTTLPEVEAQKWRDAMEKIQANGEYERILRRYRL